MEGCGEEGMLKATRSVWSKAHGRENYLQEWKGVCAPGRVSRCVGDSEAGETIKNHITLQSHRLRTGPEGAEHVHSITEGREGLALKCGPGQAAVAPPGLVRYGGSQLHPDPLT